MIGSKLNCIKVGVDTFFLGSCLIICAHLDNLRESFDGNFGNKKNFVERHQKILELIDDLNRFFQPIVFVQFFSSSMLLCVLGFQLVMLQNFIKWATAAVFGVTIISELFIFAYGGQLILDTSLSVCDHFYESDKDLIILIRRAHKASKVKMGFYEATLPYFCAILGSAGSLITMLKSLAD